MFPRLKSLRHKELELRKELDRLMKKFLQSSPSAAISPEGKRNGGAFDMEVTQLRAPGLSHIASSINGEILESLHAEIANSVEIVRMRSISDPTGRQVSACSTKKDAVHKFSKDCVETNDLHISFADLLISSEYEDVSKVEVASPQRA